MGVLKIIVDVIVVALVALLVFLGVKRGFVKSFFKSTKIFFVILVTILIGSLVVSLCQNWFVDGWFDGKVSGALVEKAQKIDGELTFEALTESVPALAKKIVPMGEIEEYFNTLSGNKVDIANQIGTKIEDIAIKVVSNVIGYVLAFVLSFVICTIAILIIEKVWELPVLGWLNHAAGVLWGVANAYLVTSFVVCIVALIFGNAFIEGTVVARIIYKIGLFTF
ncbi:MAG: CvpA family protein [Clostridia bacterium]|nr:CvpA family protein [Clostridia bacterium]